MVADQGIVKTPSSSTVNWSCSPLALMVGVDHKSGVIVGNADILLSGPFLRFHRGFVINQPITFDHVQTLGVGSAVNVDHGKWPLARAHRDGRCEEAAWWVEHWAAMVPGFVGSRPRHQTAPSLHCATTSWCDAGRQLNAAFDAHLIGIDPDYRLHVSERLLGQKDGPMLEVEA